MAVEVAFCRPLRPGSTGDDVRAHKIALSRWDSRVYPWGKFTNYYGPYFQAAVKVYQRRKGITPATGYIGRATHESLERALRRGTKEPAFDRNSRALAKEFCTRFAVTPNERIRKDILDAAEFWYANRWSIRYAQTRPFLLIKPPSIPVSADCSEFVTVAHFAAGAPDPNGRGYDGHGYTGTLMNRGTRVASVYNLEPGDLIFYGWTSRAQPGFPVGSPTHVALYAGGLMVYSFGSYPMRYTGYSYRGINHFRHYRVA